MEQLVLEKVLSYPAQCNEGNHKVVHFFFTLHRLRLVCIGTISASVNNHGTYFRGFNIYKQGCGAGAGRNQSFWPEPELEPEYRSFGSGSRFRVSLSILKKSNFILNRI
jgi:hypothetical protein